jgi:hypothetical protein
VKSATGRQSIRRYRSPHMSVPVNEAATPPEIATYRRSPGRMSWSDATCAASDAGPGVRQDEDLRRSVPRARVSAAR